MTLGDLIKRLEAEPPETVCPFGFRNPHSYRGNYANLAFEPARDTTVGEMLACAREAHGRFYTGWKGGDFFMDKSVWVHLSYEGGYGEELGHYLLTYMLGGIPEPEDGV